MVDEETFAVIGVQSEPVHPCTREVDHASEFCPESIDVDRRVGAAPIVKSHARKSLAPRSKRLIESDVDLNLARCDILTRDSTGQAWQVQKSEQEPADTRCHGRPSASRLIAARWSRQAEARNDYLISRCDCWIPLSTTRLKS